MTLHVVLAFHSTPKSLSRLGGDAPICNPPYPPHSRFNFSIQNSGLRNQNSALFNFGFILAFRPSFSSHFHPGDPSSRNSENPIKAGPKSRLFRNNST